jgi:NAD(P)-dependent dehydrogenase (short-subunit alcohol dehydrogenase family)
VIDAMSSVLITGSNDGLGRDAARRLVDDGHRVVGHARSTEKADALRRELPGSPTSSSRICCHNTRTCVHLHT